MVEICKECGVELSDEYVNKWVAWNGMCDKCSDQEYKEKFIIATILVFGSLVVSLLLWAYFLYSILFAIAILMLWGPAFISYLCWYSGTGFGFN